MNRFALAVCCLVLCAVLAPEAASACSVCNGGGEESRKAFLFTTVLLSMLPVGMIGTLAWWVWRHARAAEESRES